MTTSIFKNKWVYIIMAFLMTGYVAWSQYNTVQKLEFERTVLVQNQEAYKDSLSKVRDSIQTTALFVKNLNDENIQSKDKYVILSNKYDLLVKSVHAGGKVKPTVTDSTALVTFGGKEHIALYKGWTKYTFATHDAIWNLDIDFDSIDAKSQVYYDDSTKLWTIQTTSLTEGVILRGLSTIDEATLKKIKGVVQIPEKDRSTFGIGGIISHDRIYAGIALKPLKNWMFEFNYKLFSNEIVPNESIQNQISIGAFYFLW